MPGTVSAGVSGSGVTEVAPAIARVWRTLHAAVAACEHMHEKQVVRVEELEAQLRAAKEELRRLREDLEVTKEELDDVAGNCATRAEAAAAEAQAKKACDLARTALDKNSSLGAVMVVLVVIAAIGGLTLRSDGESLDVADAADAYCRSAVQRLEREIQTLSYRVDDLE